MNRPILWTAAATAALAAGLASAQTYSTYPGYGYYDTSQPRVVRCESINSRRNFCRVDTRGGVQVYRQLSSKDCVRGRTWRATADGIAVTGGCRAEFVVNTGYDNRYQTYNGAYTTDRYGRRIYDDRYVQTRNGGRSNGARPAAPSTVVEPVNGKAQPISEMRASIERYSVDRGSLARSYPVATSPARRNRFKKYYSDWLDSLKSLNFDSMSQDGKVDYFRAVLNDYKFMYLDEQKAAEARREASRREADGRKSDAVKF